MTWHLLFSKPVTPRLAVVCLILSFVVRSPAAVLLTNAVQVRGLKAEEAEKHLPVHLNGVVIGDVEPGRSGFAIQDDTAGIFLRGAIADVARLHAGDWIEVEGTSDPGEYAPFVQCKQIWKLGTKPIPQPRRVTFDELAAGSLDAQWVEVSGIVRYCEPPRTNSRKALLELATGGGRLVVRLITPHVDGSLVDAQVRLCGVCYYLVNKRRQSLSPLLAVPSGAPVVVEVPAPAEPFAAPVRSADSLMQFTPEGSNGHRIHMRGIVTCQQPGEFWIKDGALGLHIQTQQEENLNPGDEVDVLGFPRQGEYAPMLEDAVFHTQSHEAPPVPVRLAKAKEAFDQDASLVELEAIIIDLQPTWDGWTFAFQANDGTVFKALLRQPKRQTILPDCRPGSRVRVAGLCSVTREYTGSHSGTARPQSFRLLLRFPSDVSLLQPPPWWTRQRIVWLLGTIVLVLLLAVASVMLAARWHLQKQATQRKMAEAEFSAMLAERNRVAREIHDTLAQGLGAISLHLGLVKNQLKDAPDGVQKHLEIAYHVARASLADARDAIFNMRSQVLENGDLASALDGILQQMTAGTAATGRFEVVGQSRRLSPVIENAVLRVGQEAITNAEKHAQAKEIEVKLEFADKQVRLNVRDDGCGFDPGHPSLRDGGFGLIGMRERAAQLQGSLTVHSRRGEGTKITFVVPVPFSP